MYHRKELRDFNPGTRTIVVEWIRLTTVPRTPTKGGDTPMIRFSDADPEAQADCGSKEPSDRPRRTDQQIGRSDKADPAVERGRYDPGIIQRRELFDLDLDVTQTTSRDLFQTLKILVGEVPQSPDPLPLTTTDAVDSLTLSSHYASAAEDGSDTSSEPPRRISLEPSGASMLESRSKIRRSSPAKSSHHDNGSASTDHATVIESSDRSVGTLQKFFNAAMDRYLAKERETNKDPASTRPQHQGSQDVEMESIRSSDHGSRWKYDSDNVDFPTSAQATVPPLLLYPQRVRISAISDLKEFTDKDQDEDRARAWISKVKSAFKRDQASDDEKCLTFVDLLAGSAKNWYRQRRRSTRNYWSDLLRGFQIQYGGLGVSVATQYYHTRPRSDASPLDYLYRLNVAGLRAKPKIKDGSAKGRRQHVDHYIETLEDQDLAERLNLLRLTDAEDLEEVFGARDRAKNHQKKAAFGSSKSQPTPPPLLLRAIQILDNDSGSGCESDGSAGSDSDIDSHSRIFLAANEDATPKIEKESMNLDPRLPDRDHNHQDHNSKIHGIGFNRDRCSHCGSRKYLDLGCWRPSKISEHQR
ncbi:hypothetical protein PHMEG_00016132 [Phytophthora megakarya]|uniref:Eukaryotic/viral aspartic protease n=1 Tax=Phytophthora megakarya TaxID=4795 RepID=A0A225W0N1_9STRA|nr:hypothetical protein PHMEG_00016132 [Phytophthora megakarya]